LLKSQKDENKYMIENKDNITEVQDIILNENVDERKKSSHKSVAFKGKSILCT